MGAFRRDYDDGGLEIDNLPIERCAGWSPEERNYLFAGTDSGGGRAAATYSLIGTVKLNGDHNALVTAALETRLLFNGIQDSKNKAVPTKLADIVGPQPSIPSLA